MSIFLFQLEKTIKSFEMRDVIRLYLKGVISNPESLYMTSIIYFENNKYEKAFEDINLAISIREDDKYKILRSKILNAIELQRR